MTEAATFKRTFLRLEGGREAAKHSAEKIVAIFWQNSARRLPGLLRKQLRSVLPLGQGPGEAERQEEDRRGPP